MLVKSISISLFVRIFHISVIFLLSVVLARSLGPIELGVYSVVFSIVSFGSIIVGFGLPNLVLRSIVGLMNDQKQVGIRSLVLDSIKIIWILATLLAVVMWAVLWFGLIDENSARSRTLSVGIFVIPLLASIRVSGAALRAYNKVLVGQLSEFVILPLLVLVSISIVWFYWLSDGLKGSAFTVIVVYLIAALIALFTSMIFLKKIVEAPASIVKAEKSGNDLFKMAMPFAGISILQVISAQTDMLCLAFFESDYNIGMYRPAQQLAVLSSFALVSFNYVIAPRIAQYANDGRLKEMQVLVTLVARVTSVLALVFGIIYFVWGRDLLEGFFGLEFSEGYTVLVVLSIGHIINTSFGSVGLILTMSGLEANALTGVAVAALANIVLNLLLIPTLGILGAAVATTISLTVFNILLWYKIFTKMRVDSSLLGFKVSDSNANERTSE